MGAPNRLFEYPLNSAYFVDSAVIGCRRSDSVSRLLLDSVPILFQSHRAYHRVDRPILGTLPVGMNRGTAPPNTSPAPTKP